MKIHFHARPKKQPELAWHYANEFDRPICRKGAGDRITEKAEHVTCKSCLKVMIEKGIIQDDEVTNTVG